MASLANQTTAAALYYAILGTNPSDTEFKSIGQKIENGQLTQEDYITSLLNSASGQSLYQGLTNEQVVTKVYTLIYGSAPTQNAVNQYLTAPSLSSALTQVVDNLLDYSGFDSSVLAEQALFDQKVDSILYSTTASIGSLAVQEQVAASYLAMLGRDRWVDSAGLKYWSADLTSGTTYENMIKKQLLTSEYQKRVGQLNGDDFIAKVFKIVHGAAATSEQIAVFSALGTNKSVVAAAIINDLRNSTATDDTTVSQQHSFEYLIGTSLDYKTSAVLSTTAGGGNATGTVNTNASHQISNAETAVLTNVLLNANAATTVNLKFADHLADLSIGGASAATINLSDNGVNPGVNVTVNNGSVILNASSGADKVLLTTDAVVASATGQFNLGAGNDSLKWLGNGVSNGANTVSTNITANGGLGIDTISANLLTKNIAVSAPGLTRTVTISTNASQFTNFEKVDLAGYIGKATLTGSTSGATTPANHTFDFGILTGNASNESGLTGTLTTTVNQPATSTIGSQGFVLSGLADQVHVINAAGGNSAQLEVTGNATAASSVDITFLANATDHFNVNFTATSNSDVNAGGLSLISSSTVLGGNVALGTVNIGSGGTGSFDNILSLTGSNAQVQNINVTGDHTLNLTVGSGYSNIHNIDASANTGGLDLNANVGGTGDGIITQLLKILPLSAATVPIVNTLLGLLGLNSGYHMDVEGTSANDSFNVLGNTLVSGGSGENLYQLKSSTVNSGVTISDFSSTKDTIFDATSGLTISDNTAGTAISDYGTRTTDVVDALLGTLVGGITGGVVALLGQILGIGGNGSLTNKVGLASVVWSGQSDTASSYLIIDNNNNHNLDSSDTVVYLSGQNHQQLVDTLHYA
ncbi:beta strand repeat-containing protein [Klebsiella sp. R390]|uniref:beta strand repeat-containing protein n=1 Tax=Klebsiella sp. R390 TaxID=2755400 RepID=UPI003DA9ABFE